LIGVVLGIADLVADGRVGRLLLKNMLRPYWFGDLVLPRAEAVLTTGD
jgi:hypothetical protein